jgi:chemotaxis signal transduction protein
MSDESDLGPFAAAGEGTEEQEDTLPQRHLLVFSFGDSRFGLRLEDVDSVVPYREPAAVPQAAAALAGVIQDHGRIIAVFRHPRGDSSSADAHPTRIAVCQSPRGLLGVPVGATEYIGAVGIRGEPAPGEVLDTDHGVLTYLEARRLADGVGGNG